MNDIKRYQMSFLHHRHWVYHLRRTNIINQQITRKKTQQIKTNQLPIAMINSWNKITPYITINHHKTHSNQIHSSRPLPGMSIPSPGREESETQHRRSWRVLIWYIHVKHSNKHQQIQICLSWIQHKNTPFCWLFSWSARLKSAFPYGHLNLEASIRCYGWASPRLERLLKAAWHTHCVNDMRNMFYQQIAVNPRLQKLQNGRLVL